MDRQTAKVLGPLAVAALTIGTDFTGALMLLTPIEMDFGAEITTTQWVLNIYALTFAVALVPGGRLGDLFGRRRLLLIGLAVFAAASLGCAAAPSVIGLIVARAAQGVGGALAWASLLGIAATSVREEDRAPTLGLVFGAVTTGNVIGPVLAGVVGGLGDWRWFFGINLALSVLAVVMIWPLIPRDIPQKVEERVDYLGMAVLSGAVLALLYALDLGADRGWGSGPVLGLLAVSGLLWAAFPWAQKRVADPTIPPALMRNGQFMLALLANGLVVPALFLMFLYVPQYLSKVQGWSVLTAAVGALPLMVCLAATTVLSGRLYNRMGPRRLMLIGYSLLIVGSVATAGFIPSWGYAGMLPAMVLIGVGAALCIGPAATAAVAAVAPARAGIAGGLSFMVHLGAGAIGVAAGTAILWSVSAAALRHGLAASGIALTPAKQAVLNGSTPDAAGARTILDALGPEAGRQATTLVQNAFASGIQGASVLSLICAVAGVGVVLAIHKQKPDPVRHDV